MWCSDFYQKSSDMCGPKLNFSVNVCFKWMCRFVSVCPEWEWGGLLWTASSSGAWVLEMSGVEFVCSIRWRGARPGGWAHATRKLQLWARLVRVLGSRNPSWAENSIVFNGLVFCDLLPGFIHRQLCWILSMVEQGEHKNRPIIPLICSNWLNQKLKWWSAE